MIPEQRGTSNNFKVELPTHEDVLDIVEIVNQGWHDAHLNPEIGIDEAYLLESTQRESSPLGLKRWHDRVDATVDSAEVFLRVARNETGVLGMIDARIRDESQGAILSCYVKESWRSGGNRGVAQAMASHALAWMEDLPADVLIATYNERSLGFFRRNGFTVPSSTMMLGKIPTQLWLRPVQVLSEVEK